MSKVNERMKDRGAVVGGAVTALLMAGGLATFALSGQNSGESAASAGGPAVLMAQTGDPGLDTGGGATTAPAPMGGPMGGMPTGAAGGGPSTPKLSDAERKALQGTSFKGVPDSYPKTGGNAVNFGGGASPFGGGGVTQGGTTTAPDFTKLKPYINRGRTASGSRPDPFVSYRLPKYEKPPAYAFLAPIRIAKYPEPPKPPTNPDPDLEFGPLPFVPRRVAGILYNGEVSAILEIGPPGTSAEVFIVQPGSKVPSSIPGIDDLTVTSISTTQLVLRADDGRQVTVALSGAPSLQGMNPGGPGGFGPNGGSGAPPGGGFRPGPAAPPGGGRGGAPTDF